jgi:type II secretory pathway pseudopilin PulG
MRKISSKNKKNRFNKPGFLMIEAAFSIFIVGAILVTFLTVMGSVYRTEFAKRDHVVAANLAQEGIEIIRNIRDNNWKNDKTAFESTFPGDNNCYIVGIGNDYNSITPIRNCVSKLKKAPGAYAYYGYNPLGTDTKFSRLITISSPTPDSRLITVTVNWDEKSITMTDTLYAWGDVD